jgi:hypothetical protein
MIRVRVLGGKKRWVAPMLRGSTIRTSCSYLHFRLLKKNQLETAWLASLTPIIGRESM